MNIVLTKIESVIAHQERFTVTVDGIVRGVAIHGQNASAQIYWAVEDGSLVPTTMAADAQKIHFAIVKAWDKANKGRGWRYAVHNGPQSTKKYIEDYFTIFCSKHPMVASASPVTKKADALVTRESLQALLDNADPKKVMVVVARALCALYERQTMDEQSCERTIEHNGVGFSGIDGEFASSLVVFYKKHGYLSSKQIAPWVKKGSNGFSRLTKYAKQLNEIAVEKAAQKQVA